MEEIPKYNHLKRYVNIMYEGFWTPAKYEDQIVAKDVPKITNDMSEIDRSVIERCIMLVSLVEDKVKLHWGTLVLDIPQVIVGDVGGLFSQSEVTHRISYNTLRKALKLPIPDETMAPELAGRIKYLGKYLAGDGLNMSKEKQILKKLVLFTALVERASLFSQFYILMSYSNSNRGLSTVYKLQKSTCKEERVHYQFGIDLVNIIREEHPELWDDYLVDLVSKDIKAAYKAEMDLVDWIFEKGVPEHISKEEVQNFISYNFSEICQDLDIPMDINFSEELFQNKNYWFEVSTLSAMEGDPFTGGAGDYSGKESSMDINNYKDLF